MKKAILSCCIVSVFLLSTLTAVGVQEHDEATDTQTLTAQFSAPTLTPSDTYLQIDCAGTTATSYHAGTPMLPVYRTKLTLPFGTKIVDITCEPRQIQTLQIPQKIQPAPTAVIDDGSNSQPTITPDETIYGSSAYYPGTWFTSYASAGLDENNNHKTFLTIEVYPVQYAPAADTIQFIGSFDMTIVTKAPSVEPFTTNEEYKLVIIAPSRFSSALDSLVTHKNGKGMTTLLKTTESIYDEFPGVDKPEQIKYFIKSAIETYNTSYVLLMGGQKSPFFGTPRDDRSQGTKTWWVPVRYTNLKDDGEIYDPGYISDLYYADIYDSEGNFSSWDSNDDGIFAKWDNSPGRDIIDLYPDVIIGRLPCRNTIEVNIIVKKIIAYETGTGSWYNTIIAVGGDSHDDTAGDNINEGEYVTDKILTTSMSAFTPVRLFASNKDSAPTLTPTRDNMIREITKGAGHLVFDGHGNPYSWNTHWSDYGNWTGGIQVTNFYKLKNKEKLPVCVVGGCHNSQFNVTMLAGFTDKDNSKHMWCYGIPAPECWSWWMVRKNGGGAIGSIGMTGLGYGYVGGSEDINGDGIAEPVCVEGLGGYIQILFYKAITEYTETLGGGHTGAITKYLDVFPPMSDKIDTKTVQEWALIGDPSLMLGGY